MKKHDDIKKRKDGCGMGIVKKTFFEMMENCDWRCVIAGICIAIAAIAFVVGTVLAIAEENAAWLLLWLVSGVLFGFLMGVDS